MITQKITHGVFFFSSISICQIFDLAHNNVIIVSRTNFK